MSEEHAKFAVEKVADESVKARNAQLGNKRYGALGPPDLCQLVRGGGGGLMSRSQEKGACCYCFGTDVSSPATVAAYIVGLSAKLSDMRRGTFCAFDAFSNRDVRIELVFPGTVTSHICSRDGTRAGSVSEQMWRRLQVSATLRAMDSLERDRGGLFRPAGKFPISLHNPLATPQGEAAFLKAAESVFWEAHSLGSSGGGTGTHAINLLTSTLLKHFIATRRFATAEAFFSKFRPHDPSVAVLIARAAYHDESANVSRVLGLLAALLIRHRKSVAQLLMIEQSKFLRRAGNLNAATMVAEQAVHAEHGDGTVNLCHVALLQVALCSAELGDGAKTLAALNAIEIEKVEAERPAQLSSSMDEAACEGRWPLNPASGGAPALFRGQELSTTAGDSGGSSGKGGGSSNRSSGSGSSSGGTPTGGEGGVGVHPFRRTGLQSNVYSCLVSLCNQIGWEGLLEARNAVFHVTTPPAAFGNRTSTPSSPVLTPIVSRHDSPAAAGPASTSTSASPGEDTQAYPPSPRRSGSVDVGSGGSDNGSVSGAAEGACLVAGAGAPTAPPPIHKRACARWFDSMLMCLYKDLVKLVQYKGLTSSKGFGVLTAETAVEAALLSLQLQQPSYAKLCLAEVTGTESRYGGLFFAKMLLAKQLIEGSDGVGNGTIELKLGLKLVHELSEIRKLNIAMSTTMNQRLKHLVMLAVARHGARKVVEQSKPFGKTSLIYKLVREALAWKCQGHDM